MNRISNKGITKRSLIITIFIIIAAAVLAIFGINKYCSNFSTSVKQITSPPFEGRDVIKVLIIGEDNTGGTEQKPYGLSDTIMLSNIDFTNLKVSAVSIPRDTLVNIVGYGESKINASHVFGGPKLTEEVVEELTGVRPDYYIKTNVEGFRDTVDIIGGVEIDVEKNMKYDDNWGKLHINLKKGRQVLNGEDAMGYVRFRHDKLGDITRMERQQKFIKALAKKMVEPASIPKLPWTIKSVMNNIDTDMTSKDLLCLAKFAGKINVDEIEMTTLPGVPRNINGGSYWIVDEDETYNLIRRLFLTRTIAGLPKIEVLNGSGIAGAAQEAAEALQQSGYEITSISNADSFNYASSEVINHKSETKELDKIAVILNVGIMKDEPNPDANADVTVIIGKDICYNE